MKKFFGLLVGGFLGFVVMGLGLVTVNAQTPSNGFDQQNVSYNPSTPGSGVMQNDNLIKTIKSFINRILALLGLIALVILLRGGFQMVTAAGDEAKYKKGFKILQQAGMGLIFIGLAWLFISLVFRIIKTLVVKS